MTNKLSIGSDHAGFELKEILKAEFSDVAFEDFGPGSADSVDYPDFAHPVSKAVENTEGGLGVLVCGSGNGVAMTANKHQGIRAAIAWTPELAALARQHNDANILCLPARFISTSEAVEIVKAFLEAEFEGGRHERRTSKISC